jgi:hypothetical protein
MIDYIFLAAWVICGILNYGWAYAFQQREFPTLAENDAVCDRNFAIFIGLMGPCALLALILTKAWKHGWMWRRR